MERSGAPARIHFWKYNTNPVVDRSRCPPTFLSPPECLHYHQRRYAGSGLDRYYINIITGGFNYRRIIHYPVRCAWRAPRRAPPSEGASPGESPPRAGCLLFLP